MDFETRDAYRRAVEAIAGAAGQSELDVARAVLVRARKGPPDGRCNHIGYWLVDAGRRGFERSLGARSGGLERRLVDHPHATLFGLLLLAQLTLLAPVALYLVWIEASGRRGGAIFLSWIDLGAAVTIAHRAVAGWCARAGCPSSTSPAGFPNAGGRWSRCRRCWSTTTRSTTWSRSSRFVPRQPGPAFASRC
jgi:hypothetical protein